MAGQTGVTDAVAGGVSEAVALGDAVAVAVTVQVPVLERDAVALAVPVGVAVAVALLGDALAGATKRLCVWQQLPVV